jgi:hypothetical protein
VTVTDDSGGTFSNSMAVVVGSTNKFLVVNDNSHDEAAFIYGAAGAYVGRFDLAALDPRGADTVAAGSPLWVVDKDTRVYVYDTSNGSLLGDWKAKGTKHPEGIATDGTDLWIVDDHSDRIYYYAAGAAHRLGSQDPTSYFSLANDNNNPSGLATNGSMLWVTDRSRDSVYVYDISGALMGQWELDPGNGYASGIAINPPNGPDIWVVDRSDDSVFHYPGAVTRLTGSQTAASVFELHSDNKHPEGIADPPTIAFTGPLVEPSVDPFTADLNSDGLLTAADVDLVIAGLKPDSAMPGPDLDANGARDREDLAFYVEQILKTFIGDADLDGEFNLRDLTLIFGTGEYEDAIVGNSTWFEGDFNGDGDFDSSDLIFAFSRGDFEAVAAAEFPNDDHPVGKRKRDFERAVQPLPSRPLTEQ